MERIKKIIFFIVPLIFTIYLEYLINRIWQFSIKVNLLNIFIIGILIYTFFILFYQKIKYKEIKKNKMNIIIIISLLLTFIILCFNFDFFSKKYINNIITIDFINKDINSESNNILPINGILVDNMRMNINNGKITAPFVTEINNSKDINIVFDKNQNNGIIKIIDGDIIQKVDLYSFNEDIYIYHVKGNRIMNAFSYMRMTCSFIMIGILSFMLCISSYYMYYKKKSLIIPVLFLIAIIQISFYSQCLAYTKYPDTVEYEADYTKEQIVNLQLQGRVPIYPVIIKVLKVLYGCELWSNYLSIIQILVSFISLIYLYKTLKLLIKYEGLSIFLVFIYGINISILGWNTAMLTESFALSSLVIFCYLLIKYIKETKPIYGILSSILLTLMILLRPSFISFMPILCLFFLLRFFIENKNRKINIKCFLISFLAGLLILSYAVVFYMQHGIFTIAKASLRQNLYVCMWQGFYKNSGDQEFIKDVETSMKMQEDSWKAAKSILNEYDNSKINELIKISRNNSMSNYILYIKNLIVKSSNEVFDSYYELCITNKPNFVCNILDAFKLIKFSHIYILISIELCIGIYKWIKNKKLDWINFGLFAFLIIILFTAFIGTNAEFMRTSICVVPFVYISLAGLLNDILKFHLKQ